MLEPNVASVDVAETREAFEQGFEIGVLLFRIAGMPEIADAGNPAAGLRQGDAGQRQHGPAHEREDVTPPQVEHPSAPRYDADSLPQAQPAAEGPGKSLGQA